MRKGSLRVLLIEDDPTVIGSVRRMLARQGAGAFEMESAECLAAGLERLAHEGIDVALLDLGLPGSSGLATFVKVRERAPDLPVVVLSSLEDATVGEEAVRRGAQDCLLKTDLKANLLGRSIRYAVERKQAEKALRANERFLTDVFDSIQDGLSVLNPDLTIRRANKVMREWCAHRSPLEGGKCHVCYHQKNEPCDPCPALRCLRSGRTERNVVPGLPGSSVQWLDLFSYPIKDPDSGQVTGVVEFARDITERKRAEEHLFAYQRRLRSMTSELLRAEERERQRIAAYLHDQIGQALVVLRMKFGNLREPRESVESAEAIEEIRSLLDQTIEATRSLTFELSPPVLHELGFEPAIEWIVERITKEHGIRVELENDARPKPVEEDVGVLLFRTVRELLINVVRHAQASRARVSIRKERDHVLVAVEDDGVGFDPSGKGLGTGDIAGFGLFSIRERLEHVGGHVVIESEPGRGTRVALIAPLKGRHAPSKEEST